MILDNPFHVLGLTADCGAAARTHRESMVKRYLGVGRSLVFNDDLYFNGCRRNQSTVERALASLVHARDRIRYGLFWFTEGGGAKDAEGLRLLRQGDPIAACIWWQKILESGSFTREAISPRNNFGTVCLLIALERSRTSAGTMGENERLAYLMRGVSAKVRLVGRLSEAELSRFCAALGDDIEANDPESIADLFSECIEDLREEAHKYGLVLPSDALANILDMGGVRTRRLKQRLALGPRNELERAIRACEEAYQNDSAAAGSAAQRLLAISKKHLPGLRAMMGDASVVIYQTFADRVAEALLDANIAWFKYHATRGGVSQIVDGSLVTLRYVLEITQKDQTRHAAQQGIEVMETESNRVKMKAVADEMTEWLENATDLLAEDRSYEWRMQFVQAALQVDVKNSALGLLIQARIQGKLTFGGDYGDSAEMVMVSSTVCGTLVRHALTARNVAHNEHEEEKAYGLLPLIAAHFCSSTEYLAPKVARAGGDDGGSEIGGIARRAAGVFTTRRARKNTASDAATQELHLVDDECWKDLLEVLAHMHLMQMRVVVAAARNWIRRARKIAATKRTHALHVNFVRRSLEADGQESVLSLLRAVRRKGIEIAGPWYITQAKVVYFGAEKADLESAVCSVLTSHCIAALELSRDKCEEREALKCLVLVANHFSAYSVGWSGSRGHAFHEIAFDEEVGEGGPSGFEGIEDEVADLYLVDDHECWMYLTRNRKVADRVGKRFAAVLENRLEAVSSGGEEWEDHLIVKEFAMNEAEASADDLLNDLKNVDSLVHSVFDQNGVDEGGDSGSGNSVVSSSGRRFIGREGHKGNAEEAESGLCSESTAQSGSDRDGSIGGTPWRALADPGVKKVREGDVPWGKAVLLPSLGVAVVVVVALLSGSC